MSREGFRETARLQRCCAVCGTMGAWQAHHVVSRQQLKKAGEGWREWDERNALRLCVVPVSEGSNCHYQHENAVRRVRVVWDYLRRIAVSSTMGAGVRVAR